MKAYQDPGPFATWFGGVEHRRREVVRGAAVVIAGILAELEVQHDEIQEKLEMCDSIPVGERLWAEREARAAVILEIAELARWFERLAA